MYDFPSDPSAAARRSPGPDGPPRHSVLSLVLLIAAVAVVGAIVLGLSFWALGFLFSVFGLLLKVALVVAVAAFVWKRVMRGRARRI